MELNDLNLNEINKQAKDSLTRHLLEYDAEKNVIIAKELLKPIDRIIKFSELKKCGVHKVFVLENDINKDSISSTSLWVYIIRPEIEYLKKIIKHIKYELSMNKRRKSKILFIPRKFQICEYLFEQEGVYEYVEMASLDIDLIHLDTNILSLEYKLFLKDYYIHRNQTWLSTIAQSLINIQTLYGDIPNIHLHGDCAKSVYQLMNTINDSKYDKPRELNFNNSKIGHLILIDRNVDFVTPFCTPLSYEGLLDDVYQINACTVEVPDPENPNRMRKAKVSSEDPIFERIRYLHFSDVVNKLQDLIRDMKEINDKGKLINNDISKMKDFVQNDLKYFTQNKGLVDLHFQASESLIAEKTKIDLSIYLVNEHQIIRGKEYRKTFEYIQEIINRKFDIYQVLRLMILLSVTNDGLSINDYNLLKNEFLTNYGYEKCLLLDNLDKMGLFESIEGRDETRSATSSSSSLTSSSNNLLKNEILNSKLLFRPFQRLRRNNYQTILKKLQIIPDLNELRKRDQDMSYYFNASYRPILCKYIEEILFHDKTNQQRAALFDETNKLFSGEYSFICRNASLRSGCSYSEIASLKLLANRKGYNFYFATTGFINISSFISSLEENKL